MQTSMSGSCAVCVDGVLYLFGGHHARGNTNKVQSCVDAEHSCGACGVVIRFAVFVLSDGVLHCAVQIYRLPLRAASFVWEEMKDLDGLPPSCKDKLGCWVYKNR